VCKTERIFYAPKRRFWTAEKSAQKRITQLSARPSKNRRLVNINCALQTTILDG
jgi:hypothetical protein